MLVWLIISIIVLVLSLGCLFGFIIYAKKSEYYHPNVEVFAIISGIIAFISSASLTASACLFPQWKESYNYKMANILSISRESEVEGRFVLGSGSIKETQYYFYYYETNMGVKLGKIDASKTYIIETSEYEPCIYDTKIGDSFEQYYTLYVPYNTLVTNYILN